MKKNSCGSSMLITRFKDNRTVGDRITGKNELIVNNLSKTEMPLDFLSERGVFFFFELISNPG